MKQYCKSQSITLQVICYLSFVLAILLLLLFALLMINLTYIQSYIAEFQVVMFKKQTQSTIHTYQTGFKRGIQSIMRRNYKKQEQIQLLYNFQLEHPDILVPEVVDCLTKTVDDYAKISTWCYGLFGNNAGEISEQSKLLQKLNGLLTITLPMQDQALDIFYTGTAKDQYFSIWPGDVLVNYQPHIRIWFNSHKDKVEHYHNVNILSFSPVYYHWIYKYPLISQTISLIGPQSSFDGVISVQLNFTQIFQNSPLSLSQTQAIIVDQDSNILLSQFPYTVEKLGDTAKTGFTQSDSDLILQYAYNGGRIKHQSDCEFPVDQVLCVTNQTSGQQVLIISEQILPSKLVLILVIIPTQQLKEIAQYQEFIQLKLTEITLESLLIQSYGLCGVLIVTLILIIAVKTPIKQLNDFTYSQVYKLESSIPQKLIHTTLLPTDNNQNCIAKLRNALFKLTKFAAYKVSTKGPICKFIEAFEYPKQQDFALELDLLQITVSYLLTKNNADLNTCNGFETFLTSSKQSSLNTILDRHPNVIPSRVFQKQSTRGK